MTTSTFTPAEQLAALPGPVQEALWQAARACIGASRDERVTILSALEGVAEAFLLHGPPNSGPALQMFAALGEVIAGIDRAGFPRTPEKEA